LCLCAFFAPLRVDNAKSITSVRWCSNSGHSSVADAEQLLLLRKRLRPYLYSLLPFDAITEPDTVTTTV
jgi:hypothetical protein